jgi:hypothetical protein
LSNRWFRWTSIDGQTPRTVSEHVRVAVIKQIDPCPAEASETSNLSWINRLQFKYDPGIRSFRIWEPEQRLLTELYFIMVPAIRISFAIGWPSLRCTAKSYITFEKGCNDFELPDLSWYQMGVIKLNDELALLLLDGRWLLGPIVDARPMILLLDADMIREDRRNQTTLRHRLHEIGLGSYGGLEIGALTRVA